MPRILSGVTNHASSPDPRGATYNVRQSMYGPQFYDYKFVYTQSFLWEEPFFKRNKGILGYTLGGWRIGSILTARSGAPLPIATVNGDGFSEAFFFR